MESAMSETPSSTVPAPGLGQLLGLVEDSSVKSFVSGSHKLLIDGKWQPARSGGMIDVFEPSTGEKLGEIAAGEPEDVTLAVEAARGAFDDGRWSRLTPAEREARLHRLADLMQRDAEALATIETLDNGKPLTASREVDVADAVRCVRYMAGWPTKIDGRSVTVSAPHSPLALTMKEPVGVVAAITPWNFPLGMAVQKVAPALAAGCTVVLKPAEQTSLTALRLGAIALEAGIPEGVLNVVTGLGSTVGAALVRNPQVAKISFTGSTATGIQIGKMAMDNMTRLTLELGGKSPMIVLPDCDLDLAAQGVIDGLFFNAGQVCSAAARLYVHADIHDMLLEKVAARIAALRLGHGLDPATDMGPLVSAVQRDRVRRYIDQGDRDGAQRIGGDPWEHAGWFVRPTIFTHLDPNSTLMREEIFGPVLSVARFDNLDEVVRCANDSCYGLAASIWSNNLAQVRTLANRLRAGTIWVNAHNPVDPALPFGGFALSGYGREGGPEGVDIFLETKAVWIN
jgi:phenylacetaldehyde dehydrogenase